MSSTFDDDPGVRRLGALVGAGVGLVAVVLGAISGNGAGATSGLALGGTALVLAVPLGWLFSRRAVQPGVWSAFTAAVGITAIAVPAGALLIGSAMAVGATDLTLGEAVVGALAVAALGLVFVGLPLAGVTFVVASLWVGVLRLIVGARRGVFRPLRGLRRS